MSVSGINRTSLFIPVCFILFRLQHHESTGRQRESTREQRSTLGRCWRWQPRRRPGLGHAPPDGRVAEPQIPSIPTHTPPPPAHAPPAGCSDRAQRGRRVLIRRQPSRQGWNSVVCTAKSIYWKDSSLFVQMVKARSGSSISRRNGTLWSDIPFFFLVAQKVTQRISKQNVTAGNEIFHRNQDLTSFGITQDAAWLPEYHYGWEMQGQRSSFFSVPHWE